MRKKKISVIGLGFVGLPTACILADSKNNNSEFNFNVNGIDKDIDKIRQLKINTKLVYEDDRLNKIVKKVIKAKRVNFTNKIESVSTTDIILICISFDFNKRNYFQRLRNLKELFYKIGNNVKKKTLILVETTLPPGTCDNIIIPALKKILKKRGMKISDIFFGYSFERVMPGNKYFDSIINNYRCYSGMNTESKFQCRNFLKKYINFKKYNLHEFKKLIDCESAKILENSFRAVNIAFIDEWTKFSFNTNINLNNIIDAIQLRKTHKNIMRPGLGVGGYCLTKDPDFVNISSNLYYKDKFNFPITNMSLKINKNMVISSLQFIKKRIKSMKNKKILLLGASYKQDVSDIRSSPSITLSKYLKKQKAKLYFHDPLTNKDDNKEYGISNILPNFKSFDVILFCVKHNRYKNLNLSKLSKRPLYFDLNCVLSKIQIKKMIKKKYKLEILGGQ